MYSVTIDAGVLAVPSLDCGSEEVYRYVDALLDWKQLLEEPWISIFMSERASDALIEDGFYPLRDGLKELFRSKGVTEYDVNTVAPVIEQLLQLTPSLEEHFQITDVLTEQFVTEPSLHQFTVGNKIESDLTRCLALLAILRDFCENSVRNHAFILRNSPSSGFIHIQCVVHYVEHNRNDLLSLPALPGVLHGKIPTCADFRGLLSVMDESHLWSTADGEDKKQIVIHIALYKSRLCRGLDPDWRDVPEFRFGRKFIQISEQVCLSTSDSLVSRLLRAIVETLDQQNMNDVHALRISPSGGSPQRKRQVDAAKGWRRDVDREYHLHYWECENRLIEFGSIGPHNDFDLPE